LASLVYQFGKFGDTDRTALGGYAYCDYKTEWPVYLPASFTAGTYYLSGDDPDSDDWEGWEPLFGRWPKWSESYIYTLINENGVAYWSNMLSLYAKVGFNFNRDVSINLCYQHLMAKIVVI